MCFYVFLVSGFSSWRDLSLVPQEDLKAHILSSSHVLGSLSISNAYLIGD